ncbi:Importin-alpha re-exporter [Taphrina deformans PYCC 5710]|uniref:Importin-alpha re-exporter n=1 Tax=Taphrina deformans (strain PYCC 5710 / ATCC 11124 / CBS 356.35 / IMI 108563 / JCM 9778 / NBRC 8474) TaxID=1097556 RepID=R4XJJ1_TAPDE|nr:Importin-alpha re-exporter [Taphrina deformans PYCC 5710]|eukprot:CCG83515.1 Importin-alpha re-exporter [Taphrina deformans PYCC 5710]
MLVCNNDTELAIRQASALFFKNYVRRRWNDEDPSEGITEEDKTFIKTGIVRAMIALPTILQMQVGEAITLIANKDFPSRWPTLIDDLVSNLNSTDMLIVNGVLQTAHSIFKRWRAQFRSDKLFTEIAFVLNKFCMPFLAIFKQTDNFIDQNGNNKDALSILFETLTLLMKVFYDLNSQDIPEFFEDHMIEFMSILHKYLQYTNLLLTTDQDETTAGPLEKTKASICEIAELYAQRYEEVFAMLPDFVNSAWTLLTQTTPAEKNDLLVGKALSFLTCVVRIPRHSSLFENDDVLHQFVERIALPNMALRESDQELFEDDPIEYIRRDLEGSDSDTRRRAATEFIRGLVEKFELKITTIVMNYVSHHLQQFQQDPSSNWLSKDTAMHLVTSITIKGVITKNGVTSTNLMIDINQFFESNVLPDLQASATSIHPILKLDAIKFVQTFRNQLTKKQLGDSFSLLVNHLNQANYVVATYAAVTIEALLSLKRDNQIMFTKQDIAASAEALPMSLFRLIETGQSPEKLAENDFMMRCAMRVLIASQDGMVKSVPMVLNHLNAILVEVSKNPANPKFNHYLFECYGAITRYNGPHSADVLSQIEGLAITPLLVLLQNNITEFVPYVFQLIAQMLELRHNQPLLPAYEQLLRPILTPDLWDSRGNIPALVRLLQAFLRQSPETFLTNKFLEPVLGIFQKLIASKTNDGYGLDLMETIHESIPRASLVPYEQQIFVLLLTRLNSSNTEKYTLRFIVFIYHLSILVDVGPDFIITIFERIQPGIFEQIFNGIVLPNTQKIISTKDSKTTSLGLTKFLIASQEIKNISFPGLWSTILTTQLKFLELPALDTKNDEGLIEFELDEVGFQASFVKLNTASSPAIDKWPDVIDPKTYFVERLNNTLTSDQKVQSGVNGLPQATTALLRSYGVHL